MMMCVGMFVFGLPTIAYQTLQRRSEWRYAKNSRVGTRPGSQYVGPGDDVITLSGWVAPELTGSAASIDMLRRMAGLGKPYLLLTGSGEVLGAYTINSVIDTQTLFYINGQPRRVEFTIELECVDDSQARSLLGDLLKIPVDIMDGSPADWSIFQ